MFDSYPGGGNGGVRGEIVAYDVLCVLSIIAILAAFSKTSLKSLLEEDPLSRRLVVLCGFSLVYEYKFRLGRQISHFQFMHEYGYTLVSISQLMHFVVLVAAIMDAVCLTMSDRWQRWRATLRASSKASWLAWTVITGSSIATVCYFQFYRQEAAKIFLPKQLAELTSIPLALVFFIVLIFWRAADVKAKRRCSIDLTTETVLYVYIRMIAVNFAISCSRLILIMVKTDWMVIHFIHALDGCFFALIAYKLEPPAPMLPDVAAVASQAFVNRLAMNSGSTLQMQKV